jgi:hypothetical protein
MPNDSRLSTYWVENGECMGLGRAHNDAVVAHCRAGAEAEMIAGLMNSDLRPLARAGVKTLAGCNSQRDRSRVLEPLGRLRRRQT